MAASQFEALSPLQQFNQQPRQHQQQQLQQQQLQQQQSQQQQSQQQQSQQQQSQQQQSQHQQQHLESNNGASHISPNGQGHPPSQPQPDSISLNGNTTNSPSQLPPAMMPVAAPGLIPNLGTHATGGPPNTIVGEGIAATSTDASTPVAPQRRRRPTNPNRPAKRPRSDDDAEGLPSPTAPRPHVSHPLSKGPYDTMEDAIFSLQLHVFTSGYGVSQKRTVKEKLPSGKYDPDGEIIRKDFACDKGGNDFVSQSRGERRRESKKCGCPWKAAIRRLRREGDRWFIEILETQHNHPVTMPDSMHTLPSYRRWQRENNAGIRTAISRLTHAAAIPPRDIAAYLKGDLRDPALDHIDRQILRALSMNDKDMLANEKEASSVVFEMLARRPVIILQDNGRTPSSPPAPYGYAGVHPPGYPFNDVTTPFENRFAGNFANPPNPSTPSNPMNPPNPHPHARPPPANTTTPGSTNIHPEFPLAS